VNPAIRASDQARADLCDEAEKFCEELLRINTVNPPGNERPAAEYIAERLRQVGLEPKLLESAPARTNVVTRIKGKGTQPPLLLTAHLDVVEVHEEMWKHPPFAATRAEGCLWGRGAIDMKNMAAMILATLREIRRRETPLARDIIFAAVADEEAGCNLGSRFLVENHADLIKAEYAIGEGGGYTLHLMGKVFYPIQVAEKGFCWIRARATGEPGHGSMPRKDSAIYTLAEALVRLKKSELPTHSTKWAKMLLSKLIGAQPRWARPLGRVLENPPLLARLLTLLGDPAATRGLKALLSNTASPTVLRAGAKENVIPGTAELTIDGRTLPGQSDEDLLRELRDILGKDIELEVMQSAPPVVTEPIESPLYDLMCSKILAREPGAEVIPYMIPGFTDAKYFTRMGARWYGFAPLRIEKDSGIRFADMFHGHNERVPIAGLRWGAELLHDVVTSFCGA
jgi:acetylornithine deacetylase/succinyl-diaminopimelate desuccinylase-like protein